MRGLASPLISKVFILLKTMWVQVCVCVSMVSHAHTPIP